MPELSAGLLGSKTQLLTVYKAVLRALSTSGKAMVHPLGFTILLQLDDENGGYTRVHLWERASRVGITPHSHSGHLTSIVLVGCLRNTFWDVFTESDQAKTIPIFAVTKLKRFRYYRQDGFGKLVTRSFQEYRPGDSYTVVAGAFHSNECLSNVCVTLVKRERGYGHPSRVADSVGSIGLSERIEVTLPREKLFELIEAITAEAARLEARR